MNIARFRLLPAAAAALLCGGTALAQQVISMKAGLVHIAEGEVYLDEHPVRQRITEFTEMKENGTLRTADGRAEVLLAPGSFLRMVEDSSFKLVSTKLSSIRLEVLTGRVMIEVAGEDADRDLTVVVGNATATFHKLGIYSFSAAGESAAAIRVFDGEVDVESNGQRWTLKDGRGLTASAGSWVREKFDPKAGDALYRWSKRRSASLAMANLSSARQANRSRGLITARSGAWIYNPYYGMMTYLPYSSLAYSPFGFAYYSPDMVDRAFMPAPPSSGFGGGGGMRSGSTFDSNLGYSVGGRSYGGGYATGGGTSSGAAASTGGAASGGDASPRSGEAAGGRGTSSAGGRGQ